MGRSSAEEQQIPNLRAGGSTPSAPAKQNNQVGSESGDQLQNSCRCSSVVERRAHNVHVAGSIPALGTSGIFNNTKGDPSCQTEFFS